MLLPCTGQVTLDADGPGDTYELITSVLAPGHNPIEVPDCNHTDFGAHINEVFDEELNSDVFRFHIHTSPDNDRCIKFDRQRNEIKSYDKSPDNLLGVDGETIIYRWKFKLSEGFQSSPNFTHLHQLKPVGGPFESMPMYTLTTRKGSPDRLELRYAETDDQITLAHTDLAPFINTWLSVEEKISYGLSGSYEIEIRSVSDDAVLFQYSNPSIVNWRPDADFVRPKWGIYRSLKNEQDLRDETVLYANFIVEELETVSIENLSTNYDLGVVFPNPTTNTIFINNLSPRVKLIQLYNLEGRIVLEKVVKNDTITSLDVSGLSGGVYVLSYSAKQWNQYEIIVLF